MENLKKAWKFLVVSVCFLFSYGFLTANLIVFLPLGLIGRHFNLEMKDIRFILTELFLLMLWFFVCLFGVWRFLKSLSTPSWLGRLVENSTNKGG